SMVRNHYDHLVSASDQQATLVRRQTLELGEFLVQVLGIRSLSGVFPHQVGLHQSCHGLRELRLGPCSESMTARESLLQLLLGSFTGISFSQLQRKDECCGFGGTFAVGEEAVS
ncbi:MAG: heterodisulfide reductase-related iron-sulfur binding cluster, partial [Planctomycetaceae bacterium]